MEDRFIANPEGFDIDELVKFPSGDNFTGTIRICGNIIDSGTEKDTSFLDKKCFNIRNIKKCADEKRYILYFGPRDINKIKVMAMTEIVIKDPKIIIPEVIDFVKSYSETSNAFSYPDEIILQNIDFTVPDVEKSFFAFWNQHDKGIDVANRIKLTEAESHKCKFIKRFIEIFYDIDAINLLFSIPYELILKYTEYNIKGKIEDDILKKENFEITYNTFQNLMNGTTMEGLDKIEKLDRLAFYTIVAFRKMLDNNLTKRNDEKTGIDGILFKMFTNTNKSGEKDEKIKNCLVDTKNIGSSILTIISYGGINKNLAKKGKEPLEKLYKKLQAFEKFYNSIFNNKSYRSETDYKLADDAEWTSRRTFSPYAERHLPTILSQQTTTSMLLNEQGVPTYAPKEYVDEDKREETIKTIKGNLTKRAVTDLAKNIAAKKEELRKKYILIGKKYIDDPTLDERNTEGKIINLINLNSIYIEKIKKELNDAKTLDDLELFEERRQLDDIVIDFTNKKFGIKDHTDTLEVKAYLQKIKYFFGIIDKIKDKTNLETGKKAILEKIDELNTPQKGGYIYDRKLQPIAKLETDIRQNCKDINQYFMKIMGELLESTSIEDDIRSSIPSPKMVFLMILTEYYYCNSQNYIDNSVDCKGISDNDTFSSKIISPLVSDLYSLRYDSLTTQCFRSTKFNIVLQITGHSNNYFNRTSYKLDKYHNGREKSGKKLYFYGGVVDIYGNYKSKNKAIVVCLDNSSFFNSVLEDNYKSRAYLSFDINSLPKKKQSGGGPDDTVGMDDNDGNDNDDNDNDDNDNDNDDNDDNDNDKIGPDKHGNYPEDYLLAFKLHNFIAFYTTPDGLQKAITNSTRIQSPIKIEMDLYKILLQFKQIKHYAHANYYGSTEYNMIFSTIGIESRAKGQPNKDKVARNAAAKILPTITAYEDAEKIKKGYDMILTLSDTRLSGSQKELKDEVITYNINNAPNNLSVSQYLDKLKKDGYDEILKLPESELSKLNDQQKKLRTAVETYNSTNPPPANPVSVSEYLDKLKKKKKDREDDTANPKTKPELTSDEEKHLKVEPIDEKEYLKVEPIILT
jgi:hypothetical protein